MRWAYILPLIRHSEPILEPENCCICIITMYSFGFKFRNPKLFSYFTDPNETLSQWCKLGQILGVAKVLKIYQICGRTPSTSNMNNNFYRFAYYLSILMKNKIFKKKLYYILFMNYNKCIQIFWGWPLILDVSGVTI